MLNLAIDEMPPPALRRILDAPVEAWVVGANGWLPSSGKPKPENGCLWHHAGAEGEHWSAAVQRILGLGEDAYAHGLHFDMLCHRFGLPRIVRAVKLRAAAALERKVETLGPTVPDGQPATAKV